MGEAQRFTNIQCDVPLPPQILNPSATTRRHAQFQRGMYEWKFAIRLPQDVVLKTPGNGYGKERKVFSLPETFIERHAKVMIEYELTAEVERHGLWTSTL